MIIDKINQPYDVKIHYRDGTIENVTQLQTHESMYYEAREFIDLMKCGERKVQSIPMPTPSLRPKSCRRPDAR